MKFCCLDCHYRRKRLVVYVFFIVAVCGIRKFSNSNPFLTLLPHYFNKISLRLIEVREELSPGVFFFLNCNFVGYY